MTKRYVFLFPLLVIALLSTILVPPMASAEGVKEQQPKAPLTVGSKVVLDKHIEATYLGMTEDGDGRWRAVIGAPQYLDDLTTPIQCRWDYDALEGEWVARDNLFRAWVQERQVTIEHRDQTMRWEPELSIGGKVQLSSYPLVMTYDPINHNYIGNTLEWKLGSITRRLRLIEGMAIEYYTIPAMPAGDISIKNNVNKAAGFEWTRPPVAYDNDTMPVELVLDGHDVVLTMVAMANATFPVTIDPDTTFISTASDGYEGYAVVSGWDDAHDGDESDYTAAGLSQWLIGISKSPGPYYLHRSFLYFDTSAILGSATITDAVLEVYPYDIRDDNVIRMYIVEGMPTYPHDPMVVGDWNYTHYNSFGTEYGHVNVSADWTENQYEKVNLQNSTTLKSIINKAGYTKLALVCGQDYLDDSFPSGVDWVWCWSFEKGNGFWPKLTITYVASGPPVGTTEAASSITSSSARLNAYIDDDGGEACDVRFWYNVTGSPCNVTNCTTFTQNTTWVNDTYNTGDSPYADIAGLVNCTSYCFKVQIANVNSTVNGSALCFTTDCVMGCPSNLIAYPDGSEISLVWQKGTGSTNTIIRGQAGAYPANYTAGTGVYNGTGSTALWDDVEPGTTYYFRAWGWSAGNVSACYDNATATTFPADAADAMADTPTAPSSWWTATDPSGLSDLPFYPIVNDVADDYGIPEETFWLGLVLIVIMVIGLFVYSQSHNATVSFLIVAFLIVLAATAKLLPLWTIAGVGLPVVGLMMIQRRA